MLEVCSTTLPQRAIPKILGDPRYNNHLRAQAQEFQQRAVEARGLLETVPSVTVIEPQGAFYLTVLFDEGVLTNTMSLSMPNSRVQQAIDELTRVAMAPAFRFVYQLMGATGIVVVPLSSFCSDYQGFRVTLLECDDKKRVAVFKNLTLAIGDYLDSGEKLRS